MRHYEVRDDLTRLLLSKTVSERRERVVRAQSAETWSDDDECLWWEAERTAGQASGIETRERDLFGASRRRVCLTLWQHCLFSIPFACVHRVESLRTGT